MRWAIIITVALLLAPFYVYVLSKCAALGKLSVLSRLRQLQHTPTEEKKHGKEGKSK